MGNPIHQPKGQFPALNNQETLAHCEGVLFEIPEISTYHASNSCKRWSMYNWYGFVDQIFTTWRATGRSAQKIFMSLGDQQYLDACCLDCQDHPQQEHGTCFSEFRMAMKTTVLLWSHDLYRNNEVIRRVSKIPCFFRAPHVIHVDRLAAPHWHRTSCHSDEKLEG